MPPSTATPPPSPAQASHPPSFTSELVPRSNPGQHPSLDPHDPVFTPFHRRLHPADALHRELQEQGQLDDFWELQEQAQGDFCLPALENSLSGSDCQGALDSRHALDCQEALPWYVDTPEEECSDGLPYFFAQWMKDNAARFSLSDLRKIKLKTSTIENATKRLGGGKKGTIYLLKLILIWIQNHLPQCRSQRASATELCAIGLDDRIMNEGTCCSSGTDGRVMDAGNVHLGGTSDGNYRDESGNLASTFVTGEEEGVSGLLGNPLVQQTTGNNLGLQPRYSGQLLTSSVASSNASTLSAAPTNYGHLSDEHLRDMNSFTARHSQSCVSTDQPMHMDHAELPSNFSMLNELSSGERLWHGCIAQVNASRATLQEGNHLQSFCAAGLTTQRRTSISCRDSFSFNPNTPAATTRAARKSRMSRQRWSARHTRVWPSAGAKQLSWSHHVSTAALRSVPFDLQTCNWVASSAAEVRQGRRSEKNLRLLLQKELKQSDVGNLGRIVLPKKEAETNLPYLVSRDGINLIVEDLSFSKVWNMRYRFWPNNKSRMYLLENTGDFVKLHHLKEGDYMMLYSGSSAGRYMIQGITVSKSEASTCAEKNGSSFTNSELEGVAKLDKAVESVARTVGVNNMEGSMDLAGRISSPTNGTVSEESVSEDFGSELFDDLIEQLPSDPKDVLKLEHFPSLQTSDLSTVVDADLPELVDSAPSL